MSDDVIVDKVKCSKVIEGRSNLNMISKRFISGLEGVVDPEMTSFSNVIDLMPPQILKYPKKSYNILKSFTFHGQSLF